MIYAIGTCLEKEAGKLSLVTSEKKSSEVYILPDSGKHDRCEQLNLNGAWRSLVAHLLWEQGVGGSNPLAPTKFRRFITGVQAQLLVFQAFTVWGFTKYLAPQVPH